MPSEPIAGSMLGFLSAVSTFIVGVTIFYTQREVAKRMNAPVEQQHKMIEKEIKEREYYH
jgi:hypothetical protein